MVTMEIATLNPADSLVANIGRMETALADAKTDMERLNIRDQAAAAKAAAVVLKMPTVVCEASIMVARAERAIAKANQAGPGRPWGRENNVAPEATLSIPNYTISKIRQAHDGITDEIFEQVVSYQREQVAPVHRAMFQRMGGRLNGETELPENQIGEFTSRRETASERAKREDAEHRAAELDRERIEREEREQAEREERERADREERERLAFELRREREERQAERERLAELEAEEERRLEAEREREVAREERAARREELRANPIPLPDGEFATVVIDPPWDMQKIERRVRPNQHGFDYPPMSVEEIAALPVGDKLAVDGFVFLWTTQKFLPRAFDLLEGWGLTYRFTMVWRKPGGIQPYNSAQFNCEFVVVGSRGNPQFVDTKAFSVVFEAPRAAHSEKPQEFYDLLNRVTARPRLDMFARHDRTDDGFMPWGDEVG